MDVRDAVAVRERFGKRKLANPLKAPEFGYATIAEADEAITGENTMETDDVAESMANLSTKGAAVAVGAGNSKKFPAPSPKPSSGGAAGKFNKPKKRDASGKKIRKRDQQPQQ